MLRSNVLPLLLAMAPVAGCTAGIAVGRIVDAQKVVRDAESKGAEELAAYEYRLAVRHLEEAWEEHGDAEYKTSMVYADRAKLLAQQAVVRTEGGGRDLQELRKDVEKLDDLLEEEVTPESAPSGPPKATPPPPKKEKEEEIEDFVDEASDDEIDLEGEEPAPAPPPPPPPPKTEPKPDSSSPWGKRK